MEKSIFYSKFQGKSDSELQKIVDNPKSFEGDAVIAAIQILQERNVNLSQDKVELVNSIEEKKIELKKKIAKEKKESEFSPLAKRIISAIIDLFVLSIVSYLIGFLLFATSLVDEKWEPLISWFIILFYLSFFNSNLGHQTVGKRIMKLSVRNEKNETISIKTSLLRYAFLISPYFLLNYLESSAGNGFGLLTGLKYTYYIGIFYFISTDKELRRNFHDLLTKTYVKYENQIPLNFNFPKRLYLNFLFSALGTLGFFVLMHFVQPDFTKDFQSGNLQAKQMKRVLDENRKVFGNIVQDVEKIPGINRVTGLMISVENEEVVLSITIRPSLFNRNKNLIKSVRKSFGGKTLNLNRLDKIRIIEETSFNMTLASYSKKNEINFAL